MQEIVNSLKKIISEKYQIVWQDFFISFSLPKDVNADISLNLLPISKITKKEEKQLSKEIIEELLKQKINVSYKTNNHYLNIALSTEYYQNFFTKTLKKEFNNKKEEKKINIEFVSANPTGFLHLAHLRQAFIGNALANIYKFQGFKVTKEYYINDRGQQIKHLTESVIFYYKKLFFSSFSENEKKEEKEIKYPGAHTKRIAEYLKEKWEKKFLDYHSLNEEEKEFLTSEITNLSIKEIKRDLKQCQVHFNKWTSEKKLLKTKNIERIIKKWKKKELVYKKDNCLYFKSALINDDKDRVLIKADGEFTYFFSDIFFHQKKLKTADLLINIWGADHHGYVSRLLAACELLLQQPKEKIQIILPQMTHLLTKEGNKTKFSKRLGNTIGLQECLQHIGLDELKFLCLEKKIKTELIINTDILHEKKENNLSHYIQYAHARCCSIIKRNNNKIPISANINLLNEAEKKTMSNLIQFPLVTEKVIKTNSPHFLLYYLINLSECWQKYYQKNIILDKTNFSLSSQRLLLVKVTKTILSTGLRLLGLKSPSKM